MRITKIAHKILVEDKETQETIWVATYPTRIDANSALQAYSSNPNYTNARVEDFIITDCHPDTE